jgi:hypothetical protein
MLQQEYAKNRKKAQEAGVRMLRVASTVEARINATALRDTQAAAGEAYTSWAVTEAVINARSIVDDKKSVETHAVSAAKEKVDQIYAKLASLFPKVALYTLRPDLDYSQSEEGSGVVNPRGKTLRGMAKVVWKDLVAKNKYALEVSSSYYSSAEICLRGPLPGWIKDHLLQAEATIKVEESRGRIDDFGFLTEPIVFEKTDQYLEDEYTLFVEAMENKYAVRKGNQGFSIIGGAFH